ncbi:DUF881 domain-containing protein [Nocardioides marinquilinus]|uniref:DUF881 domain-containing protein n=1 Tax=Nocardioides marinquilinus TaxID=1210400 RepID=A0ABP9P759_9ACTN
MTETDVIDVAPAGDAPPPRRGLWRFGTPVVVLLCGSLFVVSYDNSDGTDLRPGRYSDLATVTQNDAEAYERLQAEATQLRLQVDVLAGSVEDDQVREAQRRAEALRGPAGLEPVTGTGLSIVLSDAPDDVLEEALDNPDFDQKRLNRLVVHQQDIQAVVNALWAGGAQALTVQGQRIVTTTGIQCSGSAVTLQGVPYPQPYRIEAVGDPETLAAALDASSDVVAFRSDAEQPDIGVGWELAPEAEVDAPAYDGPLDTSVAEPRGEVD